MTHWQYLGALGGVIGIGWLVVVPMYRGWKPLNERMSACVRESTTLLSTLSESEGVPPESHSSSCASSSYRESGVSIR
ncbi:MULTISPECIES: hypothetical protein [unclassified Variovorax]|nr:MULTISPECIES: hypothetical protein [unclassified Variovorax]